MIRTYYFLLLAVGLFLTLSCSTPYQMSDSTKNPGDKQKISRFAGFRELGIEKETFTRIYGDPITKDMSIGANGELIESLLYIEELQDHILLKTRFSFENNRLVEQNAETETTYKKELETLQIQLNSLRHQMMFK